MGYIDNNGLERVWTRTKNYVNNKIQGGEDSGWMSPALTAKFEAYNTTNQKPLYRKYGKLICIEGAVKPKSAIAGGSTINTIFTLPTEYRPKSLVNELKQGSGSNKWMLQIGNDGVVSFSRYGTTSGYTEAVAGTWLPISCTFLSAE